MELGNILPAVQGMCDAVKSILQVDVTVIDRNLIRIAATGEYQLQIGEQLPKNCSYENILETKTPEFIDKRHFQIKCRTCEMENKCKELSTLGYPILSHNGDVLGVIGLIAFNEWQNVYFQKNYFIITQFLKKLCILIAGNIKYEETINFLEFKNIEISNIINSLDKGILIVNDDLKIENFNDKAYKLLFSYLNNMESIHLYNLFPNFNTKMTSSQIVKGFNSITNKDDYFIAKCTINGKNKYLSYIVEISEYNKELSNAYAIIDKKNNISFDDIFGKSEAMKEAISLAKKISMGKSPVFLYGEKGTGKETFARAIHNYSFIHNEPFVSLDIATTDKDLVEGELFGYEKEYISNFSEAKKSLFEQAQGGTLYMSNVDSLSLKLQQKLFSTLKNQSYRKIGGGQDLPLECRIISSTSKDLNELIKNKKFKQDLYFKLSTVPIYIPAIRERKEDLDEIISVNLLKICYKLNKPTMKLSKNLKKIFQNAQWMGNIDEIKNVLEYLVNVSNSDVIDEDLLPKNFDNPYKKVGTVFGDDSPEISPIQKTLDEIMGKFEKKVLLEYLNKYGNSTQSKKAIAKLLDINQSTLYRKLAKYGI